MVADGVWQIFLWEVGLRIWRKATLLPSEAHRNPPPLILPLLPPSSLAHGTPDAELQPLISGPPLEEHPLSLVSPVPRR